jgi:MFS family permease
MPPEFWMIAIVASPFIIGWVAQRYCNDFSTLVALFAAGITAIFLLVSLVSTWHIEHKAAMAPFDLNADGVLGELELTEEARVALSDKIPVGRFTLVALMPIVAVWNIIGLAIGSAIFRLLNSPNARTGQPQLYGQCPACGSTLGYNNALVGLEGMCPHCDASITFPAPQVPRAV